VFGAPAVAPPATHKSVIDIIDEEAKACANGCGAKFEEKIVLAIGIRMTAERFMGGEIADQAVRGCHRQKSDYSPTRQISEKDVSE